jgi:hypothetical protein
VTRSKKLNNVVEGHAQVGRGLFYQSDIVTHPLVFRKKILVLFKMCPTTPHTNPFQGNPMGKCKKIRLLGITSVGRFSNAHPIL